MTERLLVWQVEETTGVDTAWARLDADGLRARGRAAGQGATPYWIDYWLETDAELRTTVLQVRADTGEAATQVDLRRDADGWTVDGEPRPDLDGALDVDIYAGPLTNTMPIVRERLHTGPGKASLLMAFVEVPSLQVVASRQDYDHLETRDGGALVRFTAGDYVRDIEVDGDGFVVHYPTMATRL